MFFGAWCAAAALAAACGAERWRWPEPAASLRIDTKVRFTDHRDTPYSEPSSAQADEAPSWSGPQADEPPGPRGAGRAKNYNSDGTLDSLQYCKCSPTPDCNPRPDSARACGEGKFLCCYKRGSKFTQPNTEYFNEIEDERASLLPGSEGPARPFPPAPSHADLGPQYQHGAGPERGVLVGPGGPSGVIGPAPFDGAPNRNQNVLVGPGGPTGMIGPGAENNNAPRDIGPSESAQRGILVGPGGPTGVIGPQGFGQRPVLVGPGGPTGVIGPRMRGFFNQYFGGQAGPGVLVGPGGPTGRVGPGRQLLVGPGGPTGRIGPQGYYG